MSKRILLVVSGSVAAYKALELTRLLRKEGAAVTAILRTNGEPATHPKNGKPCTKFVDSEGNELDMGTPWDLFDTRSWPSDPNVSPAARARAGAPLRAVPPRCAHLPGGAELPRRPDQRPRAHLGLPAPRPGARRGGRRPRAA